MAKASENEIAKALLSMPLFSETTPAQRKTIAKLGKILTWDAGEEGIKQGSKAAAFYMILGGSVDVIRNGEKVASLNRGEPFGEVALLTGGTRNATVVARTSTELFVLGRPAFSAAIKGDPKLALKIMAAMAPRGAAAMADHAPTSERQFTVPTETELASRLVQTPLFDGTSAKQRRELAKLGKVITWKSGDAGVVQGSKAAAFYLILDGTADVTRDGSTVASLGAGDFFGEGALVRGGVRDATVTATSHAQLFVLSRPAFSASIASDPNMTLKILAAMGERRG